MLVLLHGLHFKYYTLLGRYVNHILEVVLRKKVVSGKSPQIAQIRNVDGSLHVDVAAVHRTKILHPAAVEVALEVRDAVVVEAAVARDRGEDEVRVVQAPTAAVVEAEVLRERGENGVQVAHAVLAAVVHREVRRTNREVVLR